MAYCIIKLRLPEQINENPEVKKWLRELNEAMNSPEREEEFNKYLEEYIRQFVLKGLT